MSDAAPTPEPETTPTPAAPPAETPTTGILYPEEPAAPPEGGAPAAETPEGGEPAGSNTETEEQPISTVAELIEQNQFDPEWFNSLKLDVKVNRETTPVPISELIKSYQIGKASDNVLENAKLQAKTLTSEVAAQKETLQTHLSVVASLVKNAEDMLKQEQKDINWAELRERDPAEYSAKKADFKERQERIEALKDDAKKAFHEAVAATRSSHDADIRKTVATEREALLAAIPEWKEPEKAKAETAEMVEYLTTKEGFTREEVGNTIDHRLLVIGRKAMLYDKLQGNKDAALKKVVKIPKVLKPGGGPPPKPKETTLLQDLYG